MNKKLKGYTQGSLRARVAGADPYQLVQMLMGGAIENISYAKGAIQRDDLENKSVYISKALAIIESLRASLEMDVGGSVAENLNDLYLYMTERLADASISKDVSVVDEVSGLLKEIKSAWDAIPMSDRTVAVSQLEQAQASGL